MIQVDISNIWGSLSLRDLLGAEQDIFRAHMALTGPEMPDETQLRPLLAAGSRIREESEVLIVIGGSSCVQGVINLLQGPHRNLNRSKGDPQIFFTGSSFSTRAWNELMQLIEGKDISLCVIGDTPEAAVAFRNLRWLLERKYGTDEARQRIYTAAGRGSFLQSMAAEAGWETFSSAELLPLAAAGIDIQALLRGVKTARQEFDLRSYDNPVWLYTAARILLHRKGKAVEQLTCTEPGFDRIGSWWQQRFGICEGPFPAWAQSPSLSISRQDIFETMLHFDAPEQKVPIGLDVKNLDKLNHLAGKTLDQVEEAAFQDLLDSHTNAGIPIITIDCGPLHEETLGQLYWFFHLSCCLCARLTETSDF